MFEQVAAQLKKHNMSVYCVKNRAEALETVKKLLNIGDTVGTGGSATLNECGVLELLRNGDYNFLDRYAAADRGEVEEIMHRCFTADAYICSSNAVTEDGYLYNVDGNSNRVAAVLYGPKSVIMVVGKNKIVKDIPAAINRVKTTAAPPNSKRLNCKTYCAETGICVAADGDFLTDGCSSPDRICCNYVFCGPQRQKGRIKVILVDENLGC